jgi:hypothetical protein
MIPSFNPLFFWNKGSPILIFLVPIRITGFKPFMSQKKILLNVGLSSGFGKAIKMIAIFPDSFGCVIIISDSAS